MTTATRTTGGPGWLVRWLAALPVGGSLVLSFAGLAELAGASRVAGPLVYLWPLSLDAAGAVASLVWLDRRLPVEARRAARWLALVTIVLSVAGNSLWHWLIELAQRPHVGVQMAVGAVPPLVLFAMLHVLVLAHGDHRDQPTASQPPRQARPRARLPISQRDVVLITRVTARRAVGPGGVLALPPTSGQLADQPARLASPPPASPPVCGHSTSTAHGSCSPSGPASVGPRWPPSWACPKARPAN